MNVNSPLLDHEQSRSYCGSIEGWAHAAGVGFNGVVGCLWYIGNNVNDNDSICDMLPIYNIFGAMNVLINSVTIVSFFYYRCSVNSYNFSVLTKEETRLHLLAQWKKTYNCGIGISLILTSVSIFLITFPNAACSLGGNHE